MLKGKYCHKLRWYENFGSVPDIQGRVVDFDNEEDLVIIEVFSCIGKCEPIGKRLYRLSSILEEDNDWIFYDSKSEMIIAGAKYGR